MPSLMPGTAGAKEVYAIAVILEDSSVGVPAEALGRFQIREGDSVLLTTSHPGDAGFSLISPRKAKGTVLQNLFEGVTKDRVAWSARRGRIVARIEDGRFRLVPDALRAFGLRGDERLLVIKGAAAAMAYVPVDIWRRKLIERGLNEAVHNIERLREI